MMTIKGGIILWIFHSKIIHRSFPLQSRCWYPWHLGGKFFGTVFFPEFFESKHVFDSKNFTHYYDPTTGRPNAFWIGFIGPKGEEPPWDSLDFYYCFFLDNPVWEVPEISQNFKKNAGCKQKPASFGRMQELPFIPPWNHSFFEIFSIIIIFRTQFFPDSRIIKRKILFFCKKNENFRPCFTFESKKFRFSARKSEKFPLKPPKLPCLGCKSRISSVSSDRKDAVWEILASRWEILLGSGRKTGIRMLECPSVYTRLVKI